MKLRMFAILAMVVIVASIAAPVFADRNILTPTGDTLGTGRFRLEGIVQTSDSDNKTYWAAVGVSRLEIEGQRVERAGLNNEDLLNLELSVMPQTTITPSVGVGIMDVSDEIDRTLYAAISKTMPLTDTLPLPIKNVKVTAGLGSGQIDGLFAGAQADLLGFTLQAEYDGDKFNAAIGRPIFGIATAKALWVKDDFYVGINIQPKF